MSRAICKLLSWHSSLHKLTHEERVLRHHTKVTVGFASWVVVHHVFPQWSTEFIMLVNLYWVWSPE